MKRNLRKILAATLSTALLVGTPLTVLADAPTTTAGTGNILAYKVETYVVPTSISVALNPQGYAVKIGEDESNNAITSDSQVVSLNYGVANLSTADKVVKVTLTVTGGSEITFVDSASDISSTDAAPEMYLALVPGTVTKANSGDDFEVEVVADGANTHNATAAELTDLQMTADATKAVVLGGEDSITAEKNFELDAATYNVQDNETVDFTTTQAQLASKMEITDLGGIEGFTIQGAMNTKYDWTQLTAKSLSFAPTYELIDKATADAEAAEAAITKTTGYAVWASNGLAVAASETSGFTSETLKVEVSGDGTTYATLAADKYTLAYGWVTISWDDIVAGIGAEPTDLHVRVTDGTTRYTCTPAE